MFNAFRRCFSTLRRTIERAGSLDCTVVAVTASEPAQVNLRVLSIQEGWRISFARTLDDAMQHRDATRIAVIVFDQDLPGADWRKSLSVLVQSPKPVFFVLLSPAPEKRILRTVLDCGGFDVSPWPLDCDHLAGIVNGAFAIAAAIDKPLAARDSAEPPKRLRQANILD